MRKMNSGRRWRSVLVVTALFSGATVVSAQDHLHPAGSAGVGRVDLGTSCSASVADEIARGVAMLHSFWFAESVATFRAVAEVDPSCAMAHWGIAMTEMGNPMARVMPGEEALRIGLTAAERARDLAARQSHREQMYADAVLAFYRGAGRDLRDRMTAHEESLAALNRAHPEDPEAAIFYARAIIANAPPTDLTFARQIAGANLLEPLYERFPDHPGLAHYLIHAYDAPPLAGRGTEAAVAYAGIAPSAPHALHMPSHIFTRLGYWDESIETNARSAQAEPDPNAAVHPMDYMVYAYLQLGRDADAKAVVDRAVLNSDRYYGGVLGYNFAAMPARFAVERNAWQDAAELRIPVGASPNVQALTHFARGIGAARAGAGASVQVEVDSLARMESALRAANDTYWATVVAAQRLAVSAWAARLRGDDAEALRLATEAADLEETVEKHPVTPGPLLPARELLGDLLMELSRPREALREYEATLEREPNRARTIFGAARAADDAGNPARAHTHYEALLELMTDADSTRPEHSAASDFMARQ